MKSRWRCHSKRFSFPKKTFRIFYIFCIYAPNLIAQEEGQSSPQVPYLFIRDELSNFSYLQYPTMFMNQKIAEDGLIAGKYLDGLKQHFQKKKDSSESEKSSPPCPSTFRKTGFLNNSCFGWNVDVLYFQPVVDSLLYGKTNSTTFPFPEAPGRAVAQNFTFKLGFRVGMQIPLWYDGWELDSSYMYFYPSMPPAHKTDGNQYLFMSLTNTYFPLVNNSLNIQCGLIKGNWHLKMDVLDLVFRKNCQVASSLIIAPIFGVEASTIRQRITVHYQNIRITEGARDFHLNGPLINPKKVIATSEMWGVGPELGAEMRFLMPKDFNFFFKGSFSCLFGNINTTTKYTDFLATINIAPEDSPDMLITTPQSGSAVFRQSIDSGFPVMSLQSNFSKLWTFGKKGISSIELVLGWEAQFWWNQSRVQWYSSLVSPSQEADLVLQGPFGRFALRF